MSSPSPQPRAPTGSHQAVLDAMQGLWHGRIEHLHVIAGVPRMTPRTKLLARHRAGRPNSLQGDRPSYQNCRPHPQQAKLWDYCLLVRDGVIGRIEVADGIPVYWEPVQPTSRATA